MDKHTPGPWKAEVKMNTHGGWRDPEQMVKITSEVRGEFTDGGLIAFYSTGYAEYGNNEENEANARLMAAAPDLLKTLENTVYNYQASLRLRGQRDIDEVVLQARAAIARAKAG